MTYDCFMFGGYDLDILELRFNILDPFVDYFILGESDQTFSGKPKPRYYHENRERFKRWEKKIICVNVPNYETVDPFERAGFQKEYLKIALHDCQDDDIIMFGDVDEIPSPEIIKQFYAV